MPTVTDMIVRILFPAGLGAFGWFVTYFVANQVVEFHGLRKKVYEELCFTANIADANANGFTAAQDTLRRLAAQVSALEKSLYVFPRHFLLCRRYNLTQASQGLFGLSNNLGRTGYTKAKSRADVQAGLKLPKDYSATDLDEIRAADERRAAASENG